MHYEAANPTTQGKLGSCNLLISSILVYFFYTYAYNNPDGAQCWAIATKHEPKETETSGY